MRTRTFNALLCVACACLVGLGAGPATAPTTAPAGEGEPVRVQTSAQAVAKITIDRPDRDTTLHVTNAGDEVLYLICLVPDEFGRPIEAIRIAPGNTTIIGYPPTTSLLFCSGETSVIYQVHRR